MHCEFPKRFRFEHTTKCCKHKPESVPGNETHKILWDFEIQMDHPIAARKPELSAYKQEKKASYLMDYGRPEGENQRKSTDR